MVIKNSFSGKKQIILPFYYPGLGRTAAFDLDGNGFDVKIDSAYQSSYKNVPQSVFDNYYRPVTKESLLAEIQAVDPSFRENNTVTVASFIIRDVVDG